MKLCNKLKYQPSLLTLHYKIPVNVDVTAFIHPESLPILSLITLKHLLFPKSEYFILPSKYLKQIFGRKYNNGLKELIFKCIIERKTICNKLGYYYSPDNKIAASYRLSCEYRKSLKKNKFKFIPVTIKYLPPRPKKGKYCLLEKNKSLTVNKLLDSYAGLTIDSSWINYFSNEEYYPSNHYKYPREPKSQHGIFIHSRNIIESVLNKRISITSESKCGRVYHPLILITRGLREFFRKNGQPLHNIDAKSFHPYLIASCIEDQCERNRYLDFVQKGFYEIFEDEGCSRDMIKVALQKYLSGRPTKDFKVLEIAHWFKSNFPAVPLKMMELKKKKMKFQMFLQQMESSIFVEDVFMKANFWCLPMHDGLCVLEKDLDAACELINGVCESRLGFRIPLESH